MLGLLVYLFWQIRPHFPYEVDKDIKPGKGWE